MGRTETTETTETTEYDRCYYVQGYTDACANLRTAKTAKTADHDGEEEPALTPHTVVSGGLRFIGVPYLSLTEAQIAALAPAAREQYRRGYADFVASIGPLGPWPDPGVRAG